MAIRTIRRIAPCPGYDVERVESWLQDMAARGWQLKKEGCVFGLFAFEKAPPCSTRYRLEPRKAGSGFGDVPDQEIQDLCREYGWEYTDTYGEFDIYRSRNPHAREMNTDLTVQAAALAAARKNSRTTLGLDIALAVILASGFWTIPYRMLAELGLGYHLALCFALVWSTAFSLHRWIHLGRLRRQLQENIPLDHNKPWKDRAIFHLFGKFCNLLVIFILFGVIFSSCSNSMNADGIPLEEYPGNPPFVTLDDLYPGSSFNRKRFLNGYNTYSDDPTFFSPSLITWQEYGTITTADHGFLTGPLIVHYYELRSQVLAEGLLRDIYRSAEDGRHFLPLETPQLPVDHILLYRNIYPTVLIRQGNIVVEASLGIETEDLSHMLQWATRMAQMLSEHKDTK